MRLGPCGIGWYYIIISIHAPARGATLCLTIIIRDGSISIHAPARGATENCIREYDCDWISIHAPARGATNQAAILGRIRADFNPRTREGCDPNRFATMSPEAVFQSTHPRGVRRQRAWEAEKGNRISIHAPARGATLRSGSACTRTTYFNPRTREGCDKSLSGMSISGMEFQSTHPRGVRRLHRQRNQGGCLNFNPRTREGCDRSPDQNHP